MTIKTLYICDKCGITQEKNEQFWTVGVSASTFGYREHEYVTGKHMQVCRPCLESLGIYVTAKPEHKDNPPAIPSVEDLIRELIQRCSQ